MTELLRPQDVAARLAVSVRQVQVMAAAGTLPAIKVDGCTMFDPSDLEGWIAAQKKRRMPVRLPVASETLLASAKPWPKAKCGIYFLIREGRIVYVGQAVNVLARIAQHAAVKNFDSWNWIPCSRSGLDAVERAYIDALMPELNRDTITRRRRAAAE